MTLRPLAIAFVFASALVLWPSPATAATTYTDTVSGVELGDLDTGQVHRQSDRSAARILECDG